MESTHVLEAPEQALVERAQAGDGQAFAELVGRHDGRLRALARRLLGSSDRVDDVLQEAYLKAYRNIGRFRADATAGTWLYRITYNACLDELRRRPRTLRTCTDEGLDLASTQTGPADRAVAKVEAAEVLSRLSRELRATVVLVEGLGFDYADASRVLGVPSGTVASRLNRVRAMVRAA